MACFELLVIKLQYNKLYLYCTLLNKVTKCLTRRNKTKKVNQIKKQLTKRTWKNNINQYKLIKQR